MEDGSKKIREPLFHIVKRGAIPTWKALLIRLAAVFVALVLCGILCVVLIGKNPFTVYGTLIKGAFIDEWTLFLNTALLLGFGLAVVPAFKMHYWNMGANGQITISCLAAISVMRQGELDGTASEVVLILMFLAALVAGVLWAVIPAIFKAIWGTNETLFTLMMNYIAVGLVNHFIFTWTDGRMVTLGVVNLFSERGWLPVLGNEYVLPILVILAIAVFVYIYMKYSKHGYEISVVGESENTARYVGINVKKVIIRTLIVSGVICGLIGFLYAGAISHSVSESTATIGFTAILVAWLAKFNPAVMLGVSFFVTFLNLGSKHVTTEFSLGNDYFSEIIIGIIFLCVIACEFFISYRLKRSGQKDEPLSASLVGVK